MGNFTKAGAVAAMLVAGVAWTAPAAAQATRTWVSGVGDDANPCSRTAPCKTFQGVISKTAAGGEINCLDGAGYGSVTITKSITILCDTTNASILSSGTNGIVINSASAYVVLSGLDIEGMGNSGSSIDGLHGIRVANVAALHVRNSRIHAFGGGFGIYFSPQSLSGQLFVDNVSISDSGNASSGSGGGIGVFPAAGLTANVSIANSNIANNRVAGIRLDLTGLAGSAIKAAIDNVLVTNSNTGVFAKAPSGTGTVDVSVTNSVLTNNAGWGILTNGPVANFSGRVGNTTINANTVGVQLLGGAQLLSYGDNRVDGNGTDGAFAGTVLPKK